MKKKEREDIVQDLLIEEQREKEERKIKEDFQKQIQQRMEIQCLLARQLEEKEKRIEQAQLEDARYKQQVFFFLAIYEFYYSMIIFQMLEKIMADEKINQMTTDKRRRKMIELRKDIEVLMKERRAKHAEELRTYLYLREQEKVEEDKRYIHVIITVTWQ